MTFPYAQDVIPKSSGLEPIKPDSLNTGENNKIIITERSGKTIIAPSLKVVLISSIQEQQKFEASISGQKNPHQHQF